MGGPNLLYSGWKGGCTVSEIADVACAMRLDAFTSAGMGVGYIAYVQDEVDRVLFIEFLRPREMPEPSFVIRLDGKLLGKDGMRCDKSDQFCSIAIIVDKDLRKRLNTARVLSVETAKTHDGAVQFPMNGFKFR